MCENVRVYVKCFVVQEEQKPGTRSVLNGSKIIAQSQIFEQSSLHHLFSVL